MMLEFERWLEKEYPSHSEYDFDSKFMYEDWMFSLHAAYKAGFEEGKTTPEESHR